MPLPPEHCGLLIEVVPSLNGTLSHTLPNKSPNKSAETLAVEKWLPQIIPYMDLPSRQLIAQLPLLATPLAETDTAVTGILLLQVSIPTGGEKPRFQISLHHRDDAGARLGVDFNAGKLTYRLRHSNSIKQDLTRALGVKPGIRPRILDLTAGLGKDAFVLASQGCQVVAVERHPLIYLLLADGVRRAVNDLRTQVTAALLDLRHADGRSVMAQIQSQDFDVIYLDPMYPHRDKTALVKQDMRLLRDVAGDDLDAEQLFQAALSTAGKRITVKRPLHAPRLGLQPPDLQYKGTSTRFDVYFS